jgi:hypothetical protein
MQRRGTQDLISRVDSKMNGGSRSGQVGTGQMAQVLACHGELTGEGGSGAPGDGLRRGIGENE